MKVGNNNVTILQGLSFLQGSILCIR